MTAFRVDAQLSLSLAQESALQIALPPIETDPDLGPRVTPYDVRAWLARLRLLDGVPFDYLVPDSELLPPESIRFFYLDRRWTDALVQGALSVGTVTTADRAQLESLYGDVRAEVDEAERLVRLPGGEEVPQGPAGTVTGFVLRSRAVSGWPGLHVRAYREELGGSDRDQIPESDPRRLKCLRLERLAPAVLLALFDGVPKVIHVEEPRQGIQFGVELVATGQTDQYSAKLVLRDVTTSEELAPQVAVDVPFRRGSPGVLDMRALNARMVAQARTNMGATVDSAEFAMQVLQFPFRQVFGDPAQSDEILDVFRPALSLTALEAHFRQVLEP